jgi:sterol desaturase/sphingolipid hydroxylase (fatty acid hydroxylase superfamily)
MFYLVTRCLLGFTILQSLSIFTLAYYHNWNLELAVLLGTLVAVFTGIFVEGRMPYRSDWNKNHGDLKTDITSAAMLIAVVEPVLKLVGTMVVITIYGGLNISQFYWLSSIPLLGQIIVITLLIELGRYWSHRLHHSVKPLWWLHAMHHSSKRLYVINNLRFNPLNHAINFFLGTFPVLLLMPLSEALLGYLALSQPVLMLQHANIDLKSGWLNYVFSTNELHRWHHSTETGKANSNYGSTIVIWDQIFGTFRIESVLDKTKTSIGLFESSRNYPSEVGYFRQIMSFGHLLKPPPKN